MSFLPLKYFFLEKNKMYVVQVLWYNWLYKEEIKSRRKLMSAQYIEYFCDSCALGWQLSSEIRTLGESLLFHYKLMSYDYIYWAYEPVNH